MAILFKTHFHDIDCAFKLFKKSALQNIQVKSRGAMFSAELLIRLQAAGCKISEVPVGHYPRRAGNPTGASPKVILRAFSELKDYHPELRLLVSNKP